MSGEYIPAVIKEDVDSLEYQRGKNFCAHTFIDGGRCILRGRPANRLRICIGVDDSELLTQDESIVPKGTEAIVIYEQDGKPQEIHYQHQAVKFEDDVIDVDLRTFENKYMENGKRLQIEDFFLGFKSQKK